MHTEGGEGFSRISAAEATSALRSLVRCRALSPVRAVAAVHQVRSLRTIQYPFEPFATRVWELRENVSVHDAWYVALAEWLSTELVTADKRLAASADPRCTVRCIDPG